MNTTLKSPLNKNKLTYQKPQLLELNSFLTHGKDLVRIPEMMNNGMGQSRGPS